MHTCVGVDFKHPDLVRNYVRKPIRSSQLTEYVDPCIVLYVYIAPGSGFECRDLH